MRTGLTLAAVIAFLSPLLHILRSLQGGVQPDASLFLAIQTPIAIAALPFFILVVQLSRDDQYAVLPSSEVIIRRSFVFPLAAVAFGGALKFALDTVFCPFGRVAVVDFAIYAVSVAGTLYAYFTAILLISDKRAMRSAAVEVLQERFEDSLADSVETWVGNSLLQVDLAKHGVEPALVTPRSEEYVALRTSQEGQVLDVDLGRLARFFEFLRGRSLGLPAQVTAEVDSSATSDDDDEPIAYLSKRFKEPVNNRSLELMYVRADLVAGLETWNLESQIASAFTVSHQHDHDVSIPARETLAVFREGLRRAVRQGLADRLDEGSDIYRSLAELFLGKLKRFEVTAPELITAYNPFQSGGWSEIDWMTDDFTEILEEAFHTSAPRKEILGSVIYFPIGIATLCLEARSYYLFGQVTARFLPYAYILCASIEKAEERRFAVGRCWRFVRELLLFRLAPRLRETPFEEERHELTQVADGFLSILSSHLRSSFLGADEQGFAQFLEAIRSLPDDVVGHDPPTVQFRAHLKSRVGQLLLGFEAGLLRRWLAGALVPTDCNSWRNRLGVSKPQMVHTLLQVLEPAMSSNTVQLFEWDRWILDEHKEGTGVSIDFDKSLIQTYVLRAIEGLHAAANAARHLQTLSPPSGPSQFFLEIRAVLDLMQQNPQKWQEVINPNALGLLPDLRDYFGRAHSNAIKRESDALIATPLDPERIKTFRTALSGKWQAMATMRRIFRDFGRYEETDSLPANLTYGYNKLESKSSFALGESSSVDDLGRYFGRALASSENSIVLKALLNTLPQSHISESDNVIGLLATGLDELVQKGFESLVLLTSGSTSSHILERSDQFAGASGNASAGRIGTWRSWPVVEIEAVPLDYIVVFSVSSFGRWIQDVRLDGSEVVGGAIGVYVDAIDADRARELLKENPALRNNLSESDDVSQENSVGILQQRVHLRIHDRFQIAIDNSGAGFWIGPLT